MSTVWPKFAILYATQKQCGRPSRATAARCAYSPLPSSYTIRLITSSCAFISLPRLQNLGKYKS